MNLLGYYCVVKCISSECLKMLPQSAAYKTQSPVPTNSKISLGEHISYLQSELQRAKETERKLSSEIQLLKNEKDLIKKKISSFCESLEQQKAPSAPNSLPIRWNSIQQLDSLFSYVGKLQELVHQKNDKISIINGKFESVCRENALLRGTHPKVDLRQGSPQDYYCIIRDTVTYFFNTYLFDKGEKRKQNSQVEIYYDQLIHGITDYFHKWFEEQNQLLEKRQAHIQHLENSFAEKDSKFLGTTRVKNSEILRLETALHNVTQVTQAHMHVLETEGKQMEYKLNHMHEYFLRYSKTYSPRNVSSETPNDNTLEITLKQLEKRHNKTVALIRNGTEVAQVDFIDAFYKMSHMMEKYAQIHSFQKVRERADIVNTKRNLQLIYQLQEELTLYEEKINKFQGTRESKLYLHFQEMLMRIVEKLDYIESQKKEEIKDERKKAILRAIHLRKKLAERTIQ